MGLRITSVVPVKILANLHHKSSRELGTFLLGIKVVELLEAMDWDQLEADAMSIKDIKCQYVWVWKLVMLLCEGRWRWPLDSLQYAATHEKFFSSSVIRFLHGKAHFCVTGNRLFSCSCITDLSGNGMRMVRM